MVSLWTNRGDPEHLGADRPFCYLVTDIETDGPQPGANSMRSFASVVVERDGTVGDRFEACLEPLEGAGPDPGTLEWLQGQTAVWADLVRDPQPPGEVMAAYAEWIRALPSQAVFTAHPLSFDGYWIDWYLRRFLGLRLNTGPYGGERLFLGAGLDLPSLIMGTAHRAYSQCRREFYPDAWLGGHEHNHRAIDDALGYAHLLGEMLRRGAERA